MADNKKETSVKNINVYETALIQALETAVRIGLNSSNLYDNIGVYNNLYSAGYSFIEKIVLGKYRKQLHSRGIEPAEVANTLAAELFWKKLDYIMFSRNPVKCRGLINNTAKWRVSDFIHDDMRAQNRTDPQKADVAPEQKEEASNSVQDGSGYSTENIHLSTEAGWNLIPSGIDLERDAIIHDSCLKVLESLKENRSSFEVISFLGTKVVGYKAGSLAKDFICLGTGRVSTVVLQQTAYLFRLENSFFENAAFNIHDMLITYTDEKDLAQKISHASDHARKKMKNKTRTR